jgi:branched-chain amino acid aminotransferase
VSVRVAPAPRAPDRLVWIDGELKRGADALVSVFDRGARDGGGLFETLRVYGGRPFAWERHLERMVLSAAELGFPVPPSPKKLREAMQELLAAQQLSDAVVRITVTRGIAGGRPTRTGAWIEAETVSSRLWSGARTGRASAITSPQAFEPGWIGRYKTTSRMAWDFAREQARASGVDECLLVSPAGHVLEGAASNVFVVRDGELLTPPLSHDVLPGVTRAIVLELARERKLRCRETPLTGEHLRRAEEVLLTNSVQEVLPLARLDGRDLPGRETGERLLAAYRERVAASG